MSKRKQVALGRNLYNAMLKEIKEEAYGMKPDYDWQYAKGMEVSLVFQGKELVTQVKYAYGYHEYLEVIFHIGVEGARALLDEIEDNLWFEAYVKTTKSTRDE